MTALIRRELSSAQTNEYFNYVGVIISGICFDCDLRTYKYERHRARYREIRHFHDGRSTSERYVTHIVPPNTSLTVQAVSVEELGPLQLGLMLQDNIKLLVEWLARRR